MLSKPISCGRSLKAQAFRLATHLHMLLVDSLHAVSSSSCLEIALPPNHTEEESSRRPPACFNVLVVWHCLSGGTPRSAKAELALEAGA